MQTDGRGLLLRHVGSYVPNFSDDFATEWLNEDSMGSGYHVAAKILFDYHLRSQTCGSRSLHNSSGLEDGRQHLSHHRAARRYADQARVRRTVRELQSARSTHVHGRVPPEGEEKGDEPIRYIVDAFKREKGINLKSDIDVEELYAFTRDFKTSDCRKRGLEDER